jgi:RHS repeat-associated protein
MGSAAILVAPGGILPPHQSCEAISVSQSSSLRSRSLQKKSLCRSISLSSIDSGLESSPLVSCVSYPNTTYRYTAFGGKASETYTIGTHGERNRYRFSTKYLDNEVETLEGTYYYGYRSYAVAMGRWVSRDPIGEMGGINVYGMVGNDPTTTAEFLGLAPCRPTKDPECVATAKLNYKKAQIQAKADFDKEMVTAYEAHQGRLDAAAYAAVTAMAYCLWAGPAAPGCGAIAASVYAGALVASHANYATDERAASSRHKIQEEANLQVYRAEV